MGNRILGTVGVLWGTAILISRFAATDYAGSGAHCAGQFMAGMMGLAMLGAGGYYLVKG
jgi:hypothetical protein